MSNIKDFEEGQWWLKELDAMAKDGTPDQKRAVAVVRNLMATAKTQLEAMVGEQEPVAWAVYWGLPPTRQNSVHFDKESAQVVANQIKSATEVRPLYAAPVAQQPQCVCGQPTSLGVVHRTDGPCFVYEVQQPQAEAVPSDALGSEWAPCIKRPVVVHVRNQRPGEKHVSTREGITPVKPDDLIMRGVSGEEYPIGRTIFEQTYDFVDAAIAQKKGSQ